MLVLYILSQSEHKYTDIYSMYNFRPNWECLRKMQIWSLWQESNLRLRDSEHGDAIIQDF
jgi:hypothetical protein